MKKSSPLDEIFLGPQGNFPFQALECTFQPLECTFQPLECTFQPLERKILLGEREFFLKCREKRVGGRADAIEEDAASIPRPYKGNRKLGVSDWRPKEGRVKGLGVGYARS